MTLKSHSKPITTFTLSKDSKTLVSGSYDCTVLVWDIESARCIRIFKGHIGLVYSVAISIDSYTVISGGYDKTLRVWDNKNYKNLYILKGHTDSINSIDLSYDSSLIVSSSIDFTIRIWDKYKGECIHVIDIESKYTSKFNFKNNFGYLGADLIYIIFVQISIDNSSIIASNSSNSWMIYNKTNLNWKKIFEIKYNSSGYTAVNKEMSILLYGDSDGFVTVTDLYSRKVMQKFYAHDSSVKMVSISWDNSTIVSGGSDLTVKVWDLVWGYCLSVLNVNQIIKMAVRINSIITVYGYSENSIKIWNLINDKFYLF